MDFIWILFAFACGLGVKAFSLPPLVGYLAAGFALNYLGLEPDQSLKSLADLGITLMLFTIGLKLNVRDLLKAEVWGCALSHMVIWVAFVGSLITLLSMFAIPLLFDIELATAAILGFALSFSSTVCIVKVLEESGEMKTRHGKLCIGVLVMQDIVAVIFLAIAVGKSPSIWAFALLILWFFKPVLRKILEQAGHSELLPLTGFFMALGGYELFELVEVKGDLGALLIGMLLSSHIKAAELAKSLLSFKDIFLIGFFLSIGFTALPDFSMMVTALLLMLLIPLKALLFFFLFTGLKLRGRTAYLSSVALSNFSEFGLIVAVVSEKAGWLSKEWLVILALAVSFSFISTSILYRSVHNIFVDWKTFLKRFERKQRLPEDVVVQPENAEVLVIGLGRVGKGAQDALVHLMGDKVWGMDADPVRINKQKTLGFNVFFGDGEDADLWEHIHLNNIKLILLALPSIDDSRNIIAQLKLANYEGQVAAIARYEDQRQKLLDAGINKVFNFYTEAGTGFAEESLRMIERNPNAYNA